MTSNFHRKEITKLTFRGLALRLDELHRKWSFYVVASQRRAKELSKIKNTALVARVRRAEVIPNQLIICADHAANQSCRCTSLNFPLLHSKCGPPGLNAWQWRLYYVYYSYYISTNFSVISLNSFCLASDGSCHPSRPRRSGPSHTCVWMHRRLPRPPFELYRPMLQSRHASSGG